RGSWRLNESLLRDPQITRQIKTELEAYFNTNTTADISVDTLWRAHKAVLRGLFIKHASYAKKQRLHTYNTLIQQITILTHTNKTNPSPEHYNKLRTLQAQLNEFELDKTNYILQKYKHKFFAQGNKSGKLLASKLRA
ncbi:endonuclease, partial, partial [Pelobates cultripes]